MKPVKSLDFVVLCSDCGVCPLRLQVLFEIATNLSLRKFRAVCNRLTTGKRKPKSAEATKARASCASPSRFSCAGVIPTPDPLWVAKLIQSPPKNVASIGIPCKMRFADLDTVTASALRLPKVYSLPELLKKEHKTICLEKL